MGYFMSNKINDPTDDVQVVVPSPVNFPPQTPLVQPSSSTDSTAPSGQTTVSPSQHPHKPYLSPPQEITPSDTIDPTEILNAQRKRMHDIALGMLQAWLDSLRVMADEEQHRLHSSAYLDRMERNSPLYLDRLAERSRIELAQGLENYIQNVRNNDNDAIAILPIVMSTAMIAMTAVGPAMAVDVVHVSGSVGQVIENMGTVVISQDMRAELGLIGTLMISGILYQTTVETIGDPPDASKDLKYAKDYARNVVKMIKSNQLDLFFGKKNGNIAKLIMLATALALINKLEVAKNTDIEFAGMLTGEIVFKPGDIRGEIVALIHQVLDLMPDHSLVDAVLAYIDSDPDVESLLDPSHAFENILKNYHIHRELPG